MKRSIRKITALAISVMLVATAVSCGEKNPEDITDSQEVSQSDNDPDNKPVIDIACLCQMPNDFEASLRTLDSKPYTVNFIDYYNEAREEFIAEETFEVSEILTQAREALHLDMVSGGVPDLIIAYMDTMLPLVDDGYFTDLYQLMSEDTVTKDEFLPNVLEGFERDGELPLICTGFQLKTVIAKTELVGEDMENWTLDEMIAYYDSMPEDISFLDTWETIYDLPDFMLLKIMRECIDLENGTCDFHGAFLDAFEFIERENIKEGIDFSTMSDTEINEYFNAKDTNLKDGRALLCPIYLNGINQFAAQNVYYNFGGADVTFVGHPSTDGVGTVTNSSYMEIYGILDNSDCKEEAWNFLSTYFSVGSQVKNTQTGMGLPVIDAAIDEAMEASSYENFSINAALETNGTEIVSQIDEKTKQDIADYIRSVEIDPYFDPQLENIIREEFEAVVEGEKTPEEAADMLENRISLYLNEIA
ncbi:MAG: carbohydrate ABC transporter substrate-binding protein [Ruminococcus sp.]|nr:carbohydrate ABC transporter substrate-binding protein [Ruminococcus sp.]